MKMRLTRELTVTKNQVSSIYILFEVSLNAGKKNAFIGIHSSSSIETEREMRACYRKKRFRPRLNLQADSICP